MTLHAARVVHPVVVRGAVAVDRTPEGRAVRAPRLVTPVLLLVAVLAGAARLAYLGAPISADEGGFLMLARQWHPGSSLYGDFWVDRPPLLLALFRLGDLLGGLSGLRVVGAVAAASTVLAVGVLLRRVIGGGPALVGAAVTGVLLATPSAGALPVNGELLAAPFVAWGITWAVLSLRAGAARSGALLALGAGASAACAVLVKQNMLDAIVFVAATGLFLLRGRAVRGRVVRVALGFGAGGVTAAAAVVGLAALAGTNPLGLAFAMYPFRIEAAAVMARLPQTLRLAHLDLLLAAWVGSGGALVVVAFVVAVLARRFSGATTPLAAGTVALLVYDVASIGAGGSYWSHYLVELAVPTGLAAALLLSAWRRAGVVPAALVLLSCVVGWGIGLTQQVAAPGEVVGTAIGAVSRPGDQAISLLGDADIVETAGLTSPYRYQWSLPSRTLDPKQHLLDHVITSARPTWVVVRGSATLALLNSRSAGPQLRHHYRVVGKVCGRTILLRVGRDRATPVPAVASCRLPLSTLFQHDPLTPTTPGGTR